MNPDDHRTLQVLLAGATQLHPGTSASTVAVIKAGTSICLQRCQHSVNVQPNQCLKEEESLTTVWSFTGRRLWFRAHTCSRLTPWSSHLEGATADSSAGLERSEAIFFRLAMSAEMLCTSASFAAVSTSVLSRRAYRAEFRDHWGLLARARDRV